MTEKNIRGRDRVWQIHIPLVLRAFLLLVLLFLQFEVLEIALRRYYDGMSITGSVWAPIHGYQLYIFSFAVVFPAVYLMLNLEQVRHDFHALLEAIRLHNWLPVACLQLLAYACLVYLTYQLTVNDQQPGDVSVFTLVIWGVSLLATACLWLMALAPGHVWLRYFHARYRLIFAASGIAIFATACTGWLMQLAPSLGTKTFMATEVIARLIFDDLIFEPSIRRLGTPDFTVRISNACSGYEGIALVCIFLATYLWLFRRDFRFPQVLIVFPVGIAIIWMVNVMRIITLIAIGDNISAEIAMAGFHSNAGWLGFILVSFGMIGVLHRMRFFTRDKSVARSGSDPFVDALLMPFVVLMGMSLLSAAFSADFDWLYPLKVIAVGAVLWCYRRHYRFMRYRLRADAILIGVAVFLIWLLLAPVSVQQNAAFMAQLATVSPLLMGVWIFFRFAGSSILVPLVEELAFRQYLLARLAGHDPAQIRSIPFSAFAFFISSVLFGLLHSAWLAGIVAGMAYAIARYRNGEMGDAVTAHITTNLLLAMYAMATQQWSYW